MGSRVGESGFWSRWVVLGHGGLGSGIGGGDMGLCGHVLGFGGLVDGGGHKN